MKQGQLEPNEFEIAILSCLADQEPWIHDAIEFLRILSREFTGVGSFTKFKYEDSATQKQDRRIGLDAMIRMPGVPNGMGAILFCKGNHPECLEVYTYGDDRWDGVFNGFSIEKIA